MKTPRQILLARHQAIVPKLDAIRKQSLPRRPRTESLALKLWLELIWPSRRIWAGMAGLWLAIAIFSFSTPEESTVMANAAPMSRMTAAALQEQKQMLTQLLRGDESGILDAEEPARNRTRSDRRSVQLIG